MQGSTGSLAAENERDGCWKVSEAQGGLALRGLKSTGRGLGY